MAGCDAIRMVLPHSDEDLCPGGTLCWDGLGCCNHEDWVCCENELYCAETADKCPPVIESLLMHV